MTTSKIFSVKAVAFAALMSTVLTACGGNSPAPVPPPPAPVPAPTTPTTAPVNQVTDFTKQVLIPNLKYYYGTNIRVVNQVTLKSIDNSWSLVIPVGNYSWEQFYDSFVVPMVQNGCACIVQPATSGGTTSQISIWASINYSSLNSFLNADAIYNSIRTARVEVTGNPHNIVWKSSVYTIIDLLVSSNYSYFFSSAYQYTGYPVYATGVYPVNNAIAGGFSYNNGNVSVNLSGIFTK